MNKEIVVGVDVAKDFSCFFIIDPYGNKVGKSFKVLHQLDSLNNAARKLKEVEHHYNSPAVLVMESTGHYSKIPFHFFSQNDFTVRMFNPIQTHSIKNLSVRKVKNDKLDAERIAILYRLGEIKPSNISNNEHEDLKFLCRQYFTITDEITKFKNNISSLVEQMLPGYENLFSDITCLSSLYILQNYSTPSKILAADQDELITNIAKISRRNQAWAKEKYTKLLSVAECAIKLSSTPQTAELVLRTNISIVKELLAQQTVIYNEIDVLSEQKEEIALIRSIPALGPLSSAVILSEIRDPKAFPNPRKLIAFCGIDPAVNESGKFKGTQMKISKRGSRYLRRALYMAALASIKKNNNGQYANTTLAQYYHEKIKSKPKKSALIAVMHKLVNYIFAVLRDRKPFVEYSNDQHMKNYGKLHLLKAN